MSYVLFLIYLTLFSWLLTKSRFISHSAISSKIIIFLFVLKVFTGCVHLWVLLQTSTMPDTIIFNKEGLIEYHLLFSNPKEYISNFFQSNYQTGYGELFSSTNSYWNDLTGNIIIKFLSLCDIFSFGNYYVNVIFYNYVIFFGAIGLYRVFAMVYPNKKYLLVATCFLLPSLLFFSSTIHKEGLIYAAIGIAVFNIFMALKNRRFTVGRIIYLLLALFFIFLQRNYVLVAFLPAAFAWILSALKKYPPLLTFIITYLVGAFLFFTVGSLFPTLNLPAKVVQKQWDFEHLQTPATYIMVDTLAPTFKSFALNAPQAFKHSLLRPYFTDYKLSRSLLPLSVELFIYQLLLLLFIFYRNKTGAPQIRWLSDVAGWCGHQPQGRAAVVDVLTDHSNQRAAKSDSYRIWEAPNKTITPDGFIIFGFFFSLSVLLLIGYTIPIIGAIVRYRSIYLPFILTPIVCNTNWNKIKASLKILFKF